MRTLCMLLTACALHQVVALNELTESYCSVSLALQFHTSPVGQAGHIYEVLCENIHCPVSFFRSAAGGVGLFFLAESGG